MRPLWASTSTKNPAYPDTKYVDELIGPGTINTIPPKTLAAFADHGTAELTLSRDTEAARGDLDALAAVGISLETVTRELEEQGVKSFADAFTVLLESVENRRLTALQQSLYFTSCTATLQKFPNSPGLIHRPKGEHTFA
jgi:transaldolase